MLYHNHTVFPFRTQPSPHIRFVWIHHHSPLSSPFPPPSSSSSSSHLSLVAPFHRSFQPKISRCVHRLFYPSSNYPCCHSLRGTCNYLGSPVFLNSRECSRNRESFLHSFIPREFRTSPIPRRLFIFQAAVSHPFVPVARCLCVLSTRSCNPPTRSFPNSSHRIERRPFSSQSLD